MAPVQSSRSARPKPGFTLIEISFVVIAIGALAAFGVPRFMQSIERSKAAEAFDFLGRVQRAQQRHHNQRGTFTTNLDELEIDHERPNYFRVGTVTAGNTGSLTDSWRLTLTRTGANLYGNYTVSFHQDGYDADRSTIDLEINPHTL
jgi:prepilin-type N-terminal cleavage/methylation domain-containing protein